MKLEKPSFMELLKLLFFLLTSGIIPTSFKGTFFVAKEKNKVVGGIHMTNYESFYTIEYLVVSPSKRNQGIGTNILKQVLNSQSKDVYLNCYEKLEKFYKNFDFVRITKNELQNEIRGRWLLWKFLSRLINKELLFMRKIH